MSPLHLLTRPDCPSCEGVREYLRRIGAPFTEEVAADPATAVRAHRAQLPEARFPLVFLEGRLLPDVVRAHVCGDLAEAYGRAGVAF